VRQQARQPFGIHQRGQVFAHQDASSEAWSCIHAWRINSNKIWCSNIRSRKTE
jgi:hypothetical protein